MTQDVLPTTAIFTDQAGNDVAAMFAILIGAMIAAGGGLGGGGVFVPIYILILGYPPKFAAALSQATIFGGSIVNLVMNLRKYHPTRKHRPLTDFSTLLIFEPMLLVGTIIGVLFNVMFPDILILILLAIVLSYATVRTSRKGVRLWKKETNEQRNTSDGAEKESKVTVEMQSETKPNTIAQSDSNDTDRQNIKDGKTNTMMTDDTTDDMEEVQVVLNGAHNNDNKQQDDDTDKKEDIVSNGDNNNNIKDNERTDNIDKDGTLPSGDGKPRSTSKDGLMGDVDDSRVTDVTKINSIIATNNNHSQSEVAGDGKEREKNIIQQLAEGCGVDYQQITSDKIALCEEVVERESQILKPAIVILVVWFFVSLFSILKKEDITGVVDCSAGYWVITFLPFPIMMGVSYYMTKREYDYYQIKINSGCWVPAFGDIELTGDFVRILKYPLIASIAGILGGLLGIGGGMIVSPLLIELGVIPTVAAATSAMAVMITSSSAMLQFLLLGFLQWDYTMFFMTVGIIGTFVGQTAVNYAVKEYGRVSVVIFAVAIIMGLAIILMMVNGIISLVDGVSWAFSPPC